MKLVGYLQTSLLEWPGKVSSLVFVSGCNFNCPFCHNADLVNPDKIKNLPSITETEVLTDLKKRKKWIDGVVISGGEPTLNPDLAAFLKKLKKLGLATMVQTNGSQPEVIKQLLKNKLVDFFSLDFKLPWDKYSLVSQDKTSSWKVQQSLKLILKAKIPLEVRTTVVPTIHDQERLIEMAQQLATIVKFCKSEANFNWFWQNFQTKNCLKPGFRKIEPYTQTQLKEFFQKTRTIFTRTKIRM